MKFRLKGSSISTTDDGCYGVCKSSLQASPNCDMILAAHNELFENAFLPKQVLKYVSGLVTDTLSGLS